MRHLILVALLIFDGAQASDKPCPGITTYELTQCARADFDEKDEKLQHIYEKQLKVLPPAARQKLEKEQQDWLFDREQRCNPVAEEDEWKGTMNSMVVLSCMENETHLRIIQLVGWDD